MEKSKIYFKSCENMNEVNNESIQLMVTSPPYWNLKDYLVSNQMFNQLVVFVFLFAMLPSMMLRLL